MRTPGAGCIEMHILQNVCPQGSNVGCNISVINVSKSHTDLDHHFSTETTDEQLDEIGSLVLLLTDQVVDAQSVTRLL